MTTKTKITAAAAVVLAVAVYATWSLAGDPGIAPVSPGTSHAAGRASSTFDAGKTAGEVAAPTDIERDLVAAAALPTATGGTLLVRAFYGGEERLPAAHVSLSLRLPRGDVRTARRVETDGDGVAVFDDLPAGQVRLWGDRFGRTRRAEIVAGETTEFEFVFRASMILRGRVVDAVGVPIAGAAIDVAMPGLLGRDPEQLALTDHNGEFVVRDAPAPAMVGARAAGFITASLQYAHAEVGQTATVEIKLASGGGTVEGVVFGPDGSPLGDVLVCVGAGEVQGMSPLGDTPPVLPALVRSGADGRFRAVGVAPGDQPVWARTRLAQPWRGSCVVAAYGTTMLRIDLQRPGAVRGVVVARDSTSAGGLGNWLPVAGAEIQVADWGELEHAFTRSAEDGSFVLSGLPTGEVELQVEHDDDGKAVQIVSLVAGEETRCEVRLSRGLVLRGQVRDAAGKGVAKVYIQTSTRRTGEHARWSAFAQSDANGAFSIGNCPVGRPLKLEFTSDAIAPKTLTEVNPAQGPLQVEVHRLAEPSAYIRGIVRGPDGLPMAGVTVTPVCNALDLFPPRIVTGADGAFVFGPLPAGPWRLLIHREGFPSRSVEERQLADGADWHVGDIQLELGGTAVISSSSVAMTDLRFMIAHVDTGHRYGIFVQNDAPTTPVLEPGNYRLMVWGKGMAAHAVPFTIVADRQIHIELKGKPGVRQRFEFEAGAGVEIQRGGGLKIYRGDEQIIDIWRPAPAGEPWSYDVWLLPGTYRITVAGELRAETTFTVGTGPTQPVQVRLQ